MPAPASTRLSRIELDEFWRLNTRRLELSRQADAVERELKGLKEKIETHVRAKGGEELAVVSCGYLLALKRSAGAVKWKDEYVALAGSDAAAQLQAAAPPRETLQVTPVK